MTLRRLDYQLLNGRRRVIRYVPSEWQTAEYVPLHDWRVGLIEKQTACAALSAIVDAHFNPPRRRKSFIESATDLVMAVIGVKDEEECNGR